MVQLQKEIEEEEKKLEQFNRWFESWEGAERLRRFITAYAQKSRSAPAEKHRNIASGLSGLLGRQTGSILCGGRR